MRLTRSGVSAVAAAAALFAAARVFGLVELFVMGVAVAGLVVGTALWVRFRSVDIEVRRTIRPRRIHAGDPSTVDVGLHNRIRTSPVLRVHDPVTGTRGARLTLAPLHPRATTSAAYRLPTGRRGLIGIGPMTVMVTDPFGLWVATVPAAGAEEVTVLPAVDDIPPMARTTGPDPDAGTHRGSIGRRGDDFAALRSYVVGDDLRRVHWPSSARTEDDLLVRQDDVPWHGRVCVVLDLRRHVHDAVVLERAVSAAASVVRAHVRRGDHVRLVTTGGHDSGYGAGAVHLDRILDHLAVATTGSEGGLRGTVDAAGHGGSGALVVVSGHPSPEDRAVVDGATAVPARRLVHFGDVADGSDGATVTARGAGVVAVGPGTDFATAWTTAETGHRRLRPSGTGMR